MFKCNGCEKEFNSKHGVRAHWTYCPMKDKVKLELSFDDSFEQMNWRKKRIFLIKKSEHKCSSCGFSKTRDNGQSILEIDHIDGDHTNNSIENLRVLCPNCHALTPNFRNWGRTNKKSSKRLRKGNLGFNEIQNLRSKEKELKTKEQNEIIIHAVHETFQSELINYRKWGWIGQLNDYLTQTHNLMFTQQTIGRKVKELIPDFYKQNCYKRI